MRPQPLLDQALTLIASAQDKEAFQELRNRDEAEQAYTGYASELRELRKQKQDKIHAGDEEGAKALDPEISSLEEKLQQALKDMSATGRELQEALDSKGF